MEKWGRERTDMLARYWLEADDHERAKYYAREAAIQARTSWPSIAPRSCTRLRRH